MKYLLFLSVIPSCLCIALPRDVPMDNPRLHAKYCHEQIQEYIDSGQFDDLKNYEDYYYGYCVGQRDAYLSMDAMLSNPYFGFVD